MIALRRSKGKRAFLAPLSLVLGITTVMAVAPAPAQASGWTKPQVYWTQSGSNLHAWAEAYAHDYACGIKDCAKGSDHYVQAGRLSGSSGSNATRVSSSIGFDGVGIEVGLSVPLGVSAGFVDGGSVCQHGWWNGSATWVSVDFGTGSICETSTYGWVGGMTTSVTGGSRFGSAWSVRSGSSRIKLGGL